MRKEGLKLKPHYFWLGGIFIIGGLIASAIFSLPKTSETHAYSAEDEWRTMADIEYFQDMTAAICVNTPDDYTGTLIDKRGTSPIIYRVGKLKDDNCWMTQNLRLTGVTLTSANSNVKSNYPLTATNASKNNEDGAYYDWTVATAGTNPDSGDATSDICPKNWQMPSSAQFQALYDKGNGSWVNAGGAGSVDGKAGRLMGGAFFPAAGFSGGTDAGSSGYYWSRTAGNSTGAYNLYFDPSGYISLQGVFNKTRSHSVRCVAALTDPSPYPEIPEKPSDNKNSATSTFSIEVKDAITVAGVKFTDGSGNNVILSAMPGELVNGKIDVTIGSNVAYNINLSAEKPDLTSSAGDTYKIPAITQPLTAEQLKANYGWGIMKKTDASTDATVYTGLTATGETFYTSDTPAGASTATQFNVGVSVPPTLPADTYSTEVTITAIATQ